MSIKIILFDLDGTLLPMDQDVFVKGYFSTLSKKLAPYGYDPEELTKEIWTGTALMVKNNGPLTNEEVFWNYFLKRFGEKIHEDKKLFDEYYNNEFNTVKDLCGQNPKALETVLALQEEGYRTALATNPLFPKHATANRIRWAGFDPDIFDFFTSYEVCTSCKPNPKFYQEILDKTDYKPEEILMVGNDVNEDMVAATLGMKVFLLTDCLINKENVDISQYPHGNYDDLLSYVKGL